MTGTGRQLVALAVASSLIGVTLALAWYDEHRPAYNLSASLGTLPEMFDGWRVDRSMAVDERTRELLAASDYLVRAYRRDGSELELFVAFYATQLPGVGPHAARNCLAGSWDITTMSPAQLEMRDGSVAVNRLLIRRTDAERRVLYWYQTPDRIVHNEFARKFFVAWDAIVSGHKAEAFVRVIVNNDPLAERQGLAFGAAVARELDRRLGSVLPAARPVAQHTRF